MCDCTAPVQHGMRLNSYLRTLFFPLGIPLSALMTMTRHSPVLGFNNNNCQLQQNNGPPLPIRLEKKSFEEWGLEEAVQTVAGHGLVFALLRLHLLPSSPRTSREIYSSLSLKGQDEPQQLSKTITHSCSLSVPPWAIPLQERTPTHIHTHTHTHTRTKYI